MAPKISSWVIPTELSDAKLDINSGESGNLTFRATFSDLNDDATSRFDSIGRFLFLTWKEATSGATELLSIFKDKLANGEISGVLDMRFAKPGNWSISNAMISGSDISYDETNSNSLGIDLSKLSFTVVNTNPDTVPPEISNWVNPTELSDSKLDINSGESGKLVFKATPIDFNDARNIGSGFSTLHLTWKEELSGSIKTLYLTKNNVVDGVLNIVLDMSTAKEGKWSISFADIRDFANNWIRYDENMMLHTTAEAETDKFKAAGIDLSTLSFSVLNASTPTYTLTPSATNINEGSTLTTSIARTNVASGTTLYYSLSGTGITTSDFSAGALTGSGTVGSEGSFSFSHTLANDQTTEGTETLSIKLFSDSNRLTKVGEANISIVDYVGGSTDYSYSLSKLSGLTSPNSLIGAFENYQFYNLGGNRQGIQKKGTGAIDEITGISTLTFNDTSISVSDNILGVFTQVTGKETKDAQMFRLYNASFNRFPDSEGLKYWINEYSKGITDYRNIAESFIISNEFKQRYGATNTNLEFATNMYKNILGRLPDSEGLNYWVSNLNAGTNSRVDVLGGFSESIENKNLFSQVTGFV